MRPLPVFLALVAASSAASADVISLVANHDSTLYEDRAGALANGQGPYTFVGRTDDGDLRRALLSFDLAGSIPAGSTINSVTLQMEMDRTRAGASVLNLYAVTASWGEGPSNAGSPGGAGAASMTGDATWIHRFYDTQTWATPGGDFAPAVLSSQTVDDNGLYGWGTTPTFVAAAQAWLNSPSTNFGLIVLGDESAMSAKRFATRESPNPDWRPTLIVSYTVPGPGSAGVLMVAGLLAQKRRRR